MRVKICGITNIQDALIASDAGADALGFVFYKKSVRYIDPSDVRAISEKLPPFVKKIGVFVNESAKTIDEIAKKAKLDAAQIHFDVDERFLSRLATPYIRVIRAKEKSDVFKFPNEYRLVDAFVEQFGGEGKRVDLSWFDGVDCSKIVLAGGLDKDILDNVKRFGFYGVDISSGVEIERGKKDADKVYDFIKSAKN